MELHFSEPKSWSGMGLSPYDLQLWRSVLLPLLVSCLLVFLIHPGRSVLLPLLVSGLLVFLIQSTIKSPLKETKNAYVPTDILCPFSYSSNFKNKQKTLCDLQHAVVCAYLHSYSILPMSRRKIKIKILSTLCHHSSKMAFS